MSRPMAFSIGITLLVGCGDGRAPVPGPAATGPDEPPVALPAALPPAPEGGQQLASGGYELLAGQEKFLCVTHRSPPDAARAIREIQMVGGVEVHHAVLFRSTGASEERAQWECENLADLTAWFPIWGGGTGSKGFRLPEGVGFLVGKDTQYMVQYHLLNARQSVVHGVAGLNLDYRDPAGVKPAGPFALTGLSFRIPPGAAYEETIHCAATRDMNVVGVLPHMHQLGRWANLEHGSHEGTMTEVYRRDPWNFDDQAMDPFVMTIKKGDQLRATCAWNNPSNREVTFGESTHDEMCFMVLFYYPFDGLDGCLR